MKERIKASLEHRMDIIKTMLGFEEHISEARYTYQRLKETLLSMYSLDIITYEEYDYFFSSVLDTLSYDDMNKLF